MLEHSEYNPLTERENYLIKQTEKPRFKNYLQKKQFSLELTASGQNSTSWTFDTKVISSQEFFFLNLKPINKTKILPNGK